jgi:hypothetical protein
MRGLFMVCGDLMNINVEDMIEDWAHINQAGFLARLTPRGAEHVGIVFDVSTGLYPDAEPGVMRQKQASLSFTKSRIRSSLSRSHSSNGECERNCLRSSVRFIAYLNINVEWQRVNDNSPMSTAASFLQLAFGPRRP